MTLGSRIETRLDALGMSQSDLARATGIPQTTINSLIRSGRRSTPHILKLAQALRTTPAYLMCETDDPYADAPPPPVLNAEEAEWLEILRALPPKDREAVLHIGRSMNGMVLPSRQVAPTSPTLHDQRKDYRAEKNGEEEHT